MSDSTNCPICGSPESDLGDLHPYKCGTLDACLTISNLRTELTATRAELEAAQKRTRGGITNNGGKLW